MLKNEDHGNLVKVLAALSKAKFELSLEDTLHLAAAYRGCHDLMKRIEGFKEPEKSGKEIMKRPRRAKNANK